MKAQFIASLVTVFFGATLLSSCECPKCFGSGKVSRGYQEGSRHDAGSDNGHLDSERRTEVCELCDGDGNVLPAEYNHYVYGSALQQAEPNHRAATGQLIHSSLTPEEGETANGRRERQSNQLAYVLLPACNQSTADAVALQLQAYLDSPEGEGAELNLMAYLFLYFLQCYDSAQLETILRSMPPPDGDYDGEFFRRLEPEIQNYLRLNAATVKAVEQVDDDETEAAAVQLMEELAEATHRLKASAHGLVPKVYPMPTDVFSCPGADAATAVSRGSLLTSDQLWHVCHEAQSRRKTGFPRLAVAEEHLFSLHRWCEDSEGSSPEKLLQREQALQWVAVLQRWIEQALAIHDKDSADAAADWLQRHLAEHGQPLQKLLSGGRAQSCFSLRLMSLRVKAMSKRLKSVQPAFYGSEKLRMLLD